LKVQVHDILNRQVGYTLVLKLIKYD